MQAVRGSTLVVVPVDPAGPPTSFTVGMPARELVRTPPGRYASVARVRVALLVPTTHADRVIEVVIPDGVRCLDSDGRQAVAEARIEVVAPQQFEQLRLLLDRMLRPDRPPHGWVRKQLAELAVVKLHAAIQCLRQHYVTATASPERTEELMQALRDLREPLDAEAHGRVVDLATPWASARTLLPDRLRRRLDRSTASPGSVRFRATAIEEFTLRSEPTKAYVELVVVPGDSPTLGTARAVNGINIGVLAGVAALLALVPLRPGNDSRADVLATLLTIFPTIQASRLRQPDSTRLAGLLTMRHFKVGLLTAVPGLFLAGVLAFAPTGRWLLAAALVAVGLQVGCHLWIRWLGDAAGTGRMSTAAPATAGRRGDGPHRGPPRFQRAADGVVPFAHRRRAAARPHRPPVRRRGPGRGRLAHRPAHRRAGRAHRPGARAAVVPVAGAAGVPDRRPARPGAGRGGGRSRLRRSR